MKCLRLDFPMVGDFRGFDSCTGQRRVACDFRPYLPHIVTSLHQWPSFARGLLISPILFRIMPSISNLLLMMRDTRDNRHRRIRSLEMWLDTGSIRKQLG